MNAVSHWIEERDAWWPVEKKCSWPSSTNVVGARGVCARFVAFRDSSSERICRRWRAVVPEPRGFWRRIREEDQRVRRGK